MAVSAHTLEIQKAVDGHDLASIDAILRNDDISPTEKSNLTVEALTAASVYDQPLVIEHILPLETDSIRAPEYAHEPLYRAAALDRLDLVRLLIVRHDQNEDIETWKDLLSKTISVAKSREMAEMLIDRGANIEARGANGLTVLMEASAIPVIELLIAKNCLIESQDHEGRTALRRAIELDEDQAKARLLIEHARADINAADYEGKTILMAAAVRKSRRELVRLLLSRRVNATVKDGQGRTALHHMASDRERTYRFQPNAQFDSQQVIDQDVLEQLLWVGVEPDAKDNRGRTCVQWAAELGNSGFLKILLRTEKFSVDEADFHAKTALHLATAKGHSECVTALLSEGAAIQLEDYKGRTPLHEACEAPNDVSMLVDLLLKHGADVNKKMRDGRTPLHLAAGMGNFEVVRTLLRCTTIDRNARDNFGNTPLLSASTAKHTPKRREIVKLFAPWHKHHTLSEDEKHAASLWDATIVDFDRGRAKIHGDGERLAAGVSRLSRTSVFDLLYGRSWEDENKPTQTIRPSHLPGEFSWIHLPANNVAWCQDLFTKYYVEDGMDTNSFKALERSLNEQRRGNPSQSRHMTSTCQPVTRRWDSYDEDVFEDDVPSTWDEFASSASLDILKHKKAKHRPGNNAVEFKRRLSISSMGSSNDIDAPSTPYSSASRRDTAKRRNKKHQTRVRRSSWEDVQNSNRTLRLTRIASPHGSADEQDFAEPPEPSRRDERETKVGSITDFYVFMPYLHLETTERQQQMSHLTNEVRGLESLHSTLDRNGDDGKYTALLRAHYNEQNKSLHIRRTLDQSFYAHESSNKRDADQVINRFQTSILNLAPSHAKILMVDQLWMWVIGTGLVVTSFSPRWDQTKKDPLDMFEDILSTIDVGNGKPVESVYDLATIISERCYGAYSIHGSGGRDPDFLEMYEAWIGAAMEDEVKLFELFQQDSAEASRWLRSPKASQRTSGRYRKPQTRTLAKEGRVTDFKVIRLGPKPDYEATEESFIENLLDIGWETGLLEEIKAIRDELDMLTVIFERQEQIRRTMENVIRKLSRQRPQWSAAAVLEFDDIFEDRKSVVSQPLGNTQRMKQQVNGLYGSVRDLLDLKQKHANAIEARFAREQTGDASRHGQTLAVFTFVTVIFLPMSFIASFFALDIMAMPPDTHDSQASSLRLLINLSKYVIGGVVIVAPVCFGLASRLKDICYRIINIFSSQGHDPASRKRVGWIAFVTTIFSPIAYFISRLRPSAANFLIADKVEWPQFVMNSAMACVVQRTSTALAWIGLALCLHETWHWIIEMYETRTKYRDQIAENVQESFLDGRQGPRASHTRSFVSSLMKYRDKALAYAIGNKNSSSQPRHSRSFDRKDTPGPVSGNQVIVINYLRSIRERLPRLALPFLALHMLWKRAKAVFRPRLQGGHSRIEWTCSCGDILYGDFVEGSPGSLRALADELGGRVICGPASTESSPSNSRPRASQQQSGSSSTHTAPPRNPGQGLIPQQFNTPTPSPPTTDLASSVPGRDLATSNKWLELCIRSDAGVYLLGEIDIDGIGTDQSLFHAIRETSRWFRKFPYRVPTGGVSVGFRKDKLAKPTGDAATVSVMVRPSMPGVEDAKRFKYVFDPMPMDEPPIAPQTFNHYFHKPHLSDESATWIKRFPQLHNSSFYWNSEKLAKGWGIEIEEERNWIVLVAANLIVLLVSGAVAGLSASYMQDNSTGVAIGCWMTAVQTLAIGAVFWRWTS